MKRFEQLTIWVETGELGEGCWIWPYAKTTTGYGQVRHDGKMRRVHRISYEISKGPIPDGLEVDHLCNQRGCFNPDHLRAVVHRENTMASHSNTIIRKYAERTHCDEGHPLSGPNLMNEMINGYNARRCRTCRNASGRARYKERKRRDLEGRGSTLPGGS